MDPNIEKENQNPADVLDPFMKIPSNQREDYYLRVLEGSDSENEEELTQELKDLQK